MNSIARKDPKSSWGGRNGAWTVSCEVASDHPQGRPPTAGKKRPPQAKADGTQARTTRHGNARGLPEFGFERADDQDTRHFS